jgi:uncharacterized protein YjfI (DUF2170 family)
VLREFGDAPVVVSFEGRQLEIVNISDEFDERDEDAPENAPLVFLDVR